jgi:hypothetical protein
MPEPETPRLFRVSLAEDRRIVIAILAEEDHAIPSPGEREDWQPCRLGYAEIRAALTVLHCSTDLARYEIAWKRHGKTETTSPAAI